MRDNQNNQDKHTFFRFAKNKIKFWLKIVIISSSYVVLSLLFSFFTFLLILFLFLFLILIFLQDLPFWFFLLFTLSSWGSNFKVWVVLFLFRLNTIILLIIPFTFQYFKVAKPWLVKKSLFIAFNQTLIQVLKFMNWSIQKSYCFIHIYLTSESFSLLRCFLPLDRARSVLLAFHDWLTRIRGFSLK